MKKYLVGIFAIIMCFMVVGCGKKDGPLDKIAKIFNDSDIAKSYKSYGDGYDLNASVNGDKFTITSKMNGTSSSVNFTLDGNILGNDKLTDEQMLLTALLIDSVGQYQGYKSGELTENMNAFPDEFLKYTIDKEGFELKNVSNSSSFKIDITKKVPLLDLSDFYLKPSQFSMIKQFVEEKSTGNETGKLAKLAYSIELTDDANYIYIGEKEKLTDSAYKSLLSALEVVYGTDVVDKFKEAYPSFKDGKTTVNEFTIDTNYKKEDQDNSVFKGMKIVSVTIDNK